MPLPPEQTIRFGRYPALSPDGTKICFSYQGNLWISPISGGVATRLTANDSFDSNPKWSPDGRWIAFNSDREGGAQVYLMPSIGGAAKQITFHSVPTLVGDWFPNGEGLLVTSQRDARRTGIYRLDVQTGRFKKLIADEGNCYFPSLSPDGKWVSYTRGALVDIIRKNYRGAANFDIAIAPLDRSAPPRKLTDSDKNDQWSVWGADNKTVFYCSERAGVASLWKQSREGGRPVQLVSNPPDSIRYLSVARNGSYLSYECDNRICLTAASGGSAQQVPILCRTDERGPHENFATYSGSNASEFALSPDGKRVAFVIRGDIFIVNIEKGGEAKRLTDTPTRESDLAWAPDGKTLVYSAKREDGTHLFAMTPQTKEVRQLTNGGSLDTNPDFSPDGKWIAFRRGPMTSLYVIRPDGKGEHQLATGPNVYGFRWSPDSRWVAFEKGDAIRSEDIWVVQLLEENGAIKPSKPLNVTDHPGFNNSPYWHSDGTKLAFRSNRYRNRDIETINDSGRFALYSVALQKEKEKFEEEDDPSKPAEIKPAEKPLEKIGEGIDPKTELKEVKIEPFEIERRAKQTVGLEEGIDGYALSPDGKTLLFTARSLGQSDLWQANAEGSGLQRVTTSGESPTGFEWAADSSRCYYLSRGAIKWVNRGGGVGGTVNFTARLMIERLEDYRAVFDEGWQALNDKYYDTKFHGADWKAIGKKYRALVDSVTVRQDFNYLMTQMLGELNSSHTGFAGTGGIVRQVRETGILGVMVDEEYSGIGVKVREVIPRSPASSEESLLKPGDLILSVDGKDVASDAGFDRALTDKVGKTVTLLVNSKPDKTGARTLKIKPISVAAQRDLLYEKWIDDRRELVRSASAGRLGYLHVADMGNTARNRFERELFSIGQRKEGMIIDLRYNSGGDTHDSLLKILERNRRYFTFAPRSEASFAQPERAYTKPIILLINEFALSDAEVFANGFRTLGLGKIVGTPTMGWIIFTNATTLLDGSTLRMPYLGCFTNEGKDMENLGIPPDIRVETSLGDFSSGKDPQLDRAVSELTKALK